MAGGRCHRRKMMGRGAGGGCGAEEKARPVSRPSSSSPRRSPRLEPATAVDVSSQARKALSHCSPFDAEDSGLRSATLPAGLAGFLAKHSDGRRNHKKSHGEPGPKKASGHWRPPAPGASAIWEETEEYFRPLTLADIDTLAPRVPFGPRPLDPCLFIPALGKKGEVLEVGTVKVSSSSVQVAAEEPEKLEFAEEHAEEVCKAEALEKGAPETDEAGTGSDSPTERDGNPGTGNDSQTEGDDNPSSSMNWLLGSKDRFLLTSERPNKKRKLLGGDAGLDQLLRLPHSEAGGSEMLCDVCCLGPTGMKSNGLLCCGSCKVSVHQRCYGIHEVPAGAWFCSWCKHLKGSGKQPTSLPCLLCTKEGGALKPVGGDTGWAPSSSDNVKFAHLFCSLWTPEVYVENTVAMEPVLNIGGVQETRRKLVCYLCKVKHGVCVRCSHGTCRTSFHPLCARESKHQMEIWGKFGCDNVELRTFCSKHSTSPNIISDKCSENFGLNVSDNSSVSKLPPVVPSTNRLHKLRLSRSNTEKSMVQDEITSSEIMVKKKSTSEQGTFAVRLSLENEAQLANNMDSDGVVGSANNISNCPDLALILRKLIDRGKVNVDDVASEMGISSNSLEAALLGETTAFSPGLRLKVVKWLQDSAHILKVRSSSAISSSNRVAKDNGTNAAKVTGPFVPGYVKVAGLDTPDDVVAKSLPPRRTKGNIRILKDNRISCPSPVTFTQQNGNGKLVEENNEIPVVVTVDTRGKVNDGKSSLHNQDCCVDEIDSETILAGTSKPIDSDPSLELPPGHEGNPVKLESNDLSEAHHQPPSTVKIVSSFESGIDQAGEATVTEPTALEKDLWGKPNHDVDVVVSGGKPDLIVEAPCSSYVHPFIQRRWMQVQNCVISEQKYEETYSDGHNEKMMLVAEADTSLSLHCEQQRVHSSCTDVNHALDVAKLDQLAKAKHMGVQELYPDDEVEGEMLYLQTKLLDKAVEIKHSCEDLVVRVGQNLPQELDALSKRRWDLVLVSQFLHGVREAKKRGRKERRHKEAQAVLAAAAAAAAASSRNSSLRKDANDEIVSTHQESPPKINATVGRVRISSPLVPLAKDSSRLPVAKVSADKHSGIFQMPDLWQENALSCDICRRAETVLNRVFVCSSCKVAVHLGCYRRLKNPIGSWKCELCEEIPLQSRSPRNEALDSRERYSFDPLCGLCGGFNGAFRKSMDGQWVHAICAEWLLESKYKRGQQNPVDGMDAILKEKNLHSCRICNLNTGVCLKCSCEHCPITFHPSCAINVGLYMNVKANGGRVQHKAYCEKHSLEQREAECQQHGPEELKSMKQIRVELEKVRLLCERIIKREKLKRDLVICSHDLLASQRDHVAFSALVRSPFFPPGVSSESVTTSINNRSYSGTMQRSDDITVDSTISGRHIVRVPVHIDTDRKTDDSSTSQLSFKRKFPDRISSAGKQLPHRQASALRNSADGEQRSKSRKHTETFQKELVMTSDQASMQNQRLPKGFVYVPVGRLAKEKTAALDLEPCEPREPGG